MKNVPMDRRDFLRRIDNIRVPVWEGVLRMDIHSGLIRMNVNF